MADQPDIFTRLGGVRSMAQVLSEAPSTIQSWKSAGRIPAHKQPLVIERYAERGITVTAQEVVFPLDPAPAPAAASEPAQ